MEQQAISITLEDDGKGFTWEEEQRGYGLGNMQNRADKIGGTLEISSELEDGTSVRFQSNIKNIKQ